MKHGLFITLEGIDGTGKSTQLRLLVQYLKKRGLTVRATREPGGTKVGERIRNILLDSTTTRLAPLAELALMYAARAQHLQEVIRPALAKGQIVVSDRYNDARSLTRDMDESWAWRQSGPSTASFVPALSPT